MFDIAAPASPYRVSTQIFNEIYLYHWCVRVIIMYLRIEIRLHDPITKTNIIYDIHALTNLSAALLIFLKYIRTNIFAICEHKTTP